MQFVHVNGVSVPALGFGTYRLSDQEVEKIFPEALSVGFRHFDTAQIYGNEAALGRAIRRSGIQRSELFLTTKAWITNYSEEKFSTCVDESLEKLGVDQVDLLLLHWPGNRVPISQQIALLNEVKLAGKTKHIGVSNQNISQMRESAQKVSILTNQVEMHPYLDQSKLLAAAKQLGTSVSAYHAMAEGKVFSDTLIKEIAQKYNKTPAQIVLRWLLQQGVIVLSKTASVARVAENFAVFDFTLTDNDNQEIRSLHRPNGRLLDPEGLAPPWDK